MSLPDASGVLMRILLSPLITTGIAFVAIIAATYLGISPAFAQGFMVNPLRLEATASPGKSVELPLRINNTSTVSDQAIELRIADLSQAPEGNWLVAGPGQIPHDASAVDWVSLDGERIVVPAAATIEPTVTIKVPAGTQGVYFAALLAETPRQPEAEGLVVRVRFLIPVIVRIQGSPPRQRVDLDAATMTYQTADESGVAPTTMAGLAITNRGRTFPRVRGQLLIDRQSGDRWRPVTKIDIPERGIIPGATVNLGDNLHRRLPSGNYRLRGLLWVDGRRAGTLEDVIEFVGDPNIDALAYDTILGLEPEIVRMDAVPGGTRATIVQVENPSEYSIRVQAAAITPNAIQGMALGEIRGDEFSAAPWTQIRPAEFTLRPGGRQNIRVVGAVPREGANLPNYYADIVLQGVYEDGQSAGTTRSTVQLVNAAVETKSNGIIDQMQVAEGDGPSKLVVQARFVNVGNAHVDPFASAQVLGPRGEHILRSSLSGDEGVLLPLAVRSYSEQLDFSKVDPGTYVLRATVNYGSGQEAAKQLRIAVANKSGVREVTVLEDATPEMVSE